MVIAGADVCLNCFADTVIGTTSILETGRFRVKRAYLHANLEKDGFDRGDGAPSIVR